MSRIKQDFEVILYWLLGLRTNRHLGLRRYRTLLKARHWSKKLVGQLKVFLYVTLCCVFTLLLNLLSHPFSNPFLKLSHSFPEASSESDRVGAVRRKSRRSFVTGRPSADRRKAVHAQRLHRHRRRVVARDARYVLRHIASQYVFQLNYEASRRSMFGPPIRSWSGLCSGLVLPSLSKGTAPWLPVFSFCLACFTLPASVSVCLAHFDLDPTMFALLPRFVVT